MIPALAEAERSIRSAAVNNRNRRVFGVSRMPVIFAMKAPGGARGKCMLACIKPRVSYCLMTRLGYAMCLCAETSAGANLW